MRESCIFDYMDNYLLNSNVELNTLSRVPGMIAQVAINSNNDLKFGSSSDINAVNLKHEWFHLFQKYNGGINVFDNSNTGMTEFEYRNEYMNWLNEITQIGTTYPTDFNDSEFQYFSTIFGAVSISYNAQNRGYIWSRKL